MIVKELLVERKLNVVFSRSVNKDDADSFGVSRQCVVPKHIRGPASRASLRMVMTVAA